MKQVFVYPRLDEASSLVGLERVRRTFQTGGQQVQSLVRLINIADEQATAVATGGTPISRKAIEKLRSSVMDDMAEFIIEGGQVHNRTRFDIQLGRSLHQKMEIVVSDASHHGVWNYLAVDVFPDLIATRFRELHRDRFVESRRNALRRVWEREHILGDLQAGAINPLGEDELVGLLERTAVARNKNLVRALAARVLAYEGRDRSVFARKLYFEAAVATGPLLLDAMSESEIGDFVDQIQI